MFTICALENTPARLCVSKSTTSDSIIAQVIVDRIIERGLIASVDEEKDSGEVIRSHYTKVS